MPPYRLQTLLEIRERAEEEAKQAFSEAMKALAKEKQKLVDLEQDLENRKAARKQKIQEFLAEVMKKGIGAGGMGQMNRFEDRLKDEEKQVALEIERQKESVRQAEQLVEQRRLEMADAAKEKKAIEKHKENWAKEVRKERMAREELAQEEIGNTLHLQRTRAAEKVGKE
jgi:flagellar export protein FliJ